MYCYCGLQPVITRIPELIRGSGALGVCCKRNQQRVQLACAIECDQVIEAPDMTITDKYLWHRSASAAAIHHDQPLVGLCVNFDFTKGGVFAL